MFIEALENRQLCSAAVETSTPLAQSDEPTVNVSAGEQGSSVSDQVRLGLRKSSGGPVSGAAYIAFVFKV